MPPPAIMWFRDIFSFFLFIFHSYKVDQIRNVEFALLQLSDVASVLVFVNSG